MRRRTSPVPAPPGHTGPANRAFITQAHVRKSVRVQWSSFLRCRRGPRAAPPAHVYSRSSEPVRFERDCDAVLVPQGEAVTLPAGSVGYITQALGGSWTVFVEGNLMRIAGRDADAIGKEPPTPIELPDGASDEEVERLVWTQLRTCFDPEIPINIVDLGLVYEANVARDDEGRRRIEVRMTLTAPGCGMGDILVDDVRSKLEMIPTVAEADVELVFDPPWGRHMMSEAARLETGMF